MKNLTAVVLIGIGLIASFCGCQKTTGLSDDFVQNTSGAMTDTYNEEETQESDVFTTNENGALGFGEVGL